MSEIPTWGLVPKAQDDSTTIDDAIAAAVSAHNDDPTAHMAAGQSIDVHRTNTIIDHPAGSVVGDKAARVHQISTDFIGQGSIYKYGNATFDFGGVYAYTTAVTNNVTVLTGNPSGWEPVDFTKHTYMRYVAKLVQTTQQLIMLGIGCDDLGDGMVGAGFRIEDGSLYGYHALDSGSGAVFTKTAISGVTLTDWNTYEMEMDPVLGTLTFYVNGVQKAQFTSGIPTDPDDNAIMIEIKTTANVAKYINVGSFLLQVDY